MGNALPGDIFCAKSHNSHGDVSKDKDREEEQIEDLAGLGTVNLLLLGDQGDAAEDQQGAVDAEQAAAHTQSGALHHHGGGGGQTCQQAAAVEQQGGQGEQGGGGNDHQHVIALEAAPEDALHQGPAVAGEDLIKPLVQRSRWFQEALKVAGCSS